jgi:Domain of unknown function (DUF4157)
MPAQVQPRLAMPPHDRRVQAGSLPPRSVIGPTRRPLPPSLNRPAALQPAAGSAFQVPENFVLRPPGMGQRLPEAVQRKMESFFGVDFSGVRVHVGAEAPSIGALAFTIGSDLYFAPGQYNPASPHGQRLLGHELTHVVQQRAGRVRNPFGSGTAVVQDAALESEAERMGQRAAAAPASVQAKRANRRPFSPTERRSAYSGVIAPRLSSAGPSGRPGSGAAMAGCGPGRSLVSNQRATGALSPKIIDHRSVPQVRLGSLLQTCRPRKSSSIPLHDKPLTRDEVLTLFPQSKQKKQSSRVQSKFQECVRTLLQNATGELDDKTLDKLASITAEVLGDKVMSTHDLAFIHLAELLLNGINPTGPEYKRLAAAVRLLPAASVPGGPSQTPAEQTLYHSKDGDEALISYQDRYSRWIHRFGLFVTEGRKAIPLLSLILEIRKLDPLAVELYFQKNFTLIDSIRLIQIEEVRLEIMNIANAHLVCHDKLLLDALRTLNEVAKKLETSEDSTVGFGFVYHEIKELKRSNPTVYSKLLTLTQIPETAPTFGDCITAILKEDKCTAKQGDKLRRIIAANLTSGEGPKLLKWLAGLDAEAGKIPNRIAFQQIRRLVSHRTVGSERVSRTSPAPSSVSVAPTSGSGQGSPSPTQFTLSRRPRGAAKRQTGAIGTGK